jgi:ankyrin repeat protein/serine/threonine protein kinase/tetratricopeptide (TPR) repeat protein
VSSQRIAAPTGSSTILRDNTSIHGFRLVFQDVAGPEVRYRGTRNNQFCLVRECALAEAALLRWEHSLLARLKHPLLPELVEAFENQDHYYLATVFPEGLRLDQPAATVGCSERTVMSWGLALYDLLLFLEQAEVHLDLSPVSLLRSRADTLRLIDLRRTQRSPGHPTPQRSQSNDSHDLTTLGRCLYHWLGGDVRAKVQPTLMNVSAAASEVVKQLMAGRLDRGRAAFEGVCDVSPDEKPAHDLQRVALPGEVAGTCLADGTNLGGYEVRFYVRGGMSLCYLGKRGSDTRFLKEVKLSDQESAMALRNEFAIMRGLKHPNVVRCHQIFESGGYLYLVLDYIEGQSLASAAPDEERLLDWALQLSDTLDYLHSQKPPLIYRDLKPGNVVLTSRGQLYLIDFGLARTYKVGQLQDTQALGTFATASPEHFGGQTSARSDLYSLGATLFLLAVPGFKPTTQFRFPLLRTLKPGFSESFEKLLQTCLQPVPEARWPNAQTFMVEVKKLLEPLRRKSGVIDLASLAGWRGGNDSQPVAEDLSVRIPDLARHLAVSSRQLAALLENDTPLPQAVHVLGRQCEIGALGAIFQSIAADTRKGHSLSLSLRKYPTVFSLDFVKQVMQGESSGQLVAALREAAGEWEKEDLARRTGSALPSVDTNPMELSFEDARRQTRSRQRWGLVGLIFLAGLGTLLARTSGSSEISMHQRLVVGSAVSFVVALIAVFAFAIRDVRQMRVMKTARELMEDAWTNYALTEYQKAEQQLGAALVLARDKLGPSHPSTLTSLHSLANLCRQRGQFSRAADYYQQALTIYARSLPATHTARANLHHHWSQNFALQRKIEPALEQAEHSLAIWRRYVGRFPLQLAEVQCHKGRLHFDREENPPAHELFAQAFALQSAVLGLKSPLVHATMGYLTRVQLRLGLLEECEALVQQLVKELELDPDPDYAVMAEAHLNMGLIRLDQDRGREAEPYFLRALQLMQLYVGPDERLLKKILLAYRRIFGARAEQQAGFGQLLSVFMGDREKIRQSMDRQPEWLNARDNTGWGPIQWAIFLGRDDLVKWLLGRKADTGYDAAYVMGPLHVACAWNQPEALFALLEQDPDVNAPGPGGWTPVFWCALTGQLRLLDSLLNRGAQVDALDDAGRTALHIAAAKNHVKVVAALLSKGARVNAPEAHGGATPLHLAAQRGHLATCDCLTFNGANLKARNEAGQTALDLAVKNQHGLLARALRQHLSAGLGRA